MAKVFDYLVLHGCILIVLLTFVDAFIRSMLGVVEYQCLNSFFNAFFDFSVHLFISCKSMCKKKQFVVLFIGSCFLPY